MVKTLIIKQFTEANEIINIVDKKNYQNQFGLDKVSGGITGRTTANMKTKVNGIVDDWNDRH